MKARVPLGHWKIPGIEEFPKQNSPRRKALLVLPGNYGECQLWSDDLAKLQLCGDTVSQGTVWPRVLAWTSQALGMEAALLAVIQLDISFV